jgi:hypothetical protein
MSWELALSCFVQPMSNGQCMIAKKMSCRCVLSLRLGLIEIFRSRVGEALYGKDDCHPRSRKVEISD